MTYVTSSVLPVEEVPDGTSLLISGPPLTRKRELMVRLLGGEDLSEASIMVTTKMGAGKLLELYRQWNDDPPAGQLRAVDCVTNSRGMGKAQDTAITSYLSSPRDMTGLSIVLSGLFQEFKRADRHTRIGLHSLSTFLMYQDLQRVYRMLHILTGQIDAAGWFGAFVVDSPTDRELSLLSQLVDGVVDTRETDGGCELRLRGLGGRQAGWVSY